MIQNSVVRLFWRRSIYFLVGSVLTFSGHVKAETCVANGSDAETCKLTESYKETRLRPLPIDGCIEALRGAEVGVAAL